MAAADVPPAAPHGGETPADTDCRRQGVGIVATRRAGGVLILPAVAGTRIEPNDLLIAVGNVEAVAGFVKPG